MKRQEITMLILTFLLSCGQRTNNVKGSKDSIRISSADTASYQANGKSGNLDSNCSYDNQVSSLGIGLIISPTKFEIFNDSLLTDTLVSKDMYSEDGNQSPFCSKFFKPDYGIMHFVCIGKTDKAYKVLINYSDIKYLPMTRSYDFKTWDEYILGSLGIRRLSDENGDISSSLSLRIEPRDNAKTLTIPTGHEMFCPMEVNGDWVKVNYDCFYNDENNPHDLEPCADYIEKCKKPLTGWLRWRQENKLQIDISLML